MSRVVLRACVWAWMVSGCLFAGTAKAAEWYLADGQAWPGRILLQRDARQDFWYTRPLSQDDQTIPRVRSVCTTSTGQVVFCSGLDRRIMIADPRGERTLHHGGYLARQVRCDAADTIYWSGLETPQDASPLPDGFIYAYSQVTREARTLATFSQADVGRDWWGAFDIHQGRIYVATLNGPARLYELPESGIPRLVATLPIPVHAFRFGEDGALWACDGQGGLFRFSDLQRPEQIETVLRGGVPFVDFAPVR
ncbi:MAG: hypothetical protein K1X74_02040 [Pirellulales bacterium]|nr:hypothetical protein [Pirellulales bacterium]